MRDEFSHDLNPHQLNIYKRMNFLRSCLIDNHFTAIEEIMFF